MKLRQSVEDFRVEELACHKILQEKGAYKIYMLEKTGLETIALLRYLSKQNDIPQSCFGVAGLKDKHAHTSQYLTIPSAFDIKTLQEKNFTITFLGYLEKEIKVGELTGNRFKIIIRDLKKEEVPKILTAIDDLQKTGAPNYYDSQRFGSVANNVFIARYLIKKDYEKAVKVFLTTYNKHENSRIKKEKELIKKCWDDLATLNVQNRMFLKIISGQKDKSWLDAYKQIQPKLREIFSLAYQSFLWNECIKILLKKKLPQEKLCTVKYKAGKLVFYKNLGEDEYTKIPQAFKTIAPDTIFSKEEQHIVDKILRKEGIQQPELDIKATGNFFRTYERKIVVKPAELHYNFCADELNQGREKLSLSFILPKGSYTTLIVKRIML